MHRNPPCARRSYWGRGGAGMMFVCSEDRTVLLLLRAGWVEQGGTWGVPGGGIGEGHFSTPMKPITDPKVFLRKAVQEVEEECGALPPGFSETQILGTTQYEDCGFRYRTFIVDITAKQKAAWRLVSEDDETDAFVWFPWADVLSGQPLDDADQHFGVVFTMKNLPAAVVARFGRANPRCRSPRDLQTESSMKPRPPRLVNPQIDLIPLERVSQEDIGQAVRNYRPTDGAIHQERIRKAKEILARNGYEVTGPALGSGTMGTAFALAEYPGYVAKLTYDPTDASLMAEMAQIERKMEKEGKPMPPGFPKVATVAALRTPGKPFGLFVIIVERLSPLTAEQKRRIRPIARQTGWGSLARTTEGERLWKVWQRLRKSPEHAFLNVARTVHDLGYVPYDLDAVNFMRRASDGSAVVSDLGYSSPKKGTRGRQVAALRNPTGGIYDIRGSVYDLYDFVVKPTESSQQFWEPTGEGAGVRSVRYTYTRLQVQVFERGTVTALGAVSGSSEERAGTRVRLRDSACEQDFSALAARHPGLRGVIVVTGSFLEEAVRGKGVGLAMYRLFAQEAGKRGFAIAPEECWSGTALTSADAKRVWTKLARDPDMDAEGRVVYAPPRGA